MGPRSWATRPPVIEAVARPWPTARSTPPSIRARPSWPSGSGRLLPGAQVVRFATSGTEAVLMAMRLARAFTGRDKILKFEGHYHGWSDQAYISARRR